MYLFVPENTCVTLRTSDISISASASALTIRLRRVRMKSLINFGNFSG